MTHARPGSSRSPRPSSSLAAGVRRGVALVAGRAVARVLAARAAPARRCGRVQALVAGVLAALGFDPADGLYWLYALLPVAVVVRRRAAAA